MDRVEQMKKIQEEVISIIFNKNDDENPYKILHYPNLQYKNGKNYINYTNDLTELGNLQKELQNMIKIEKNIIEIIDISKLRDILIKINICAGVHFSKMNSTYMTISGVQSFGLALFKKKNADYGDAFAQYGIIGVMIRMGDKLQRLKKLYESKTREVEETIQDTIIDLHNYSAMGIMLIDE